MIIRSLATLALFSICSLARAGDFPHQEPNPEPQPAPPVIEGFCDGTFEGGLYHQPGVLTLEIHQVDSYGNITVDGWWAGRAWSGNGFCHQVNARQALLNFQFPFTPVQRAVLRVRSNGEAVLEGSVDGGDSFRLFRQPK